MKTTISLTLDAQQLSFLDRLYSEEKRTTGQPYIRYRIDADGCSITVYESNKVVFAGKKAEEHAAVFQVLKTETVATNPSVFPQAGSDEVGTGDYFGPVVVCACYTEKKHYEQFQELGITDSKAMDDAHVRIVAPQLMEVLPYSVLVVQNRKYNQVQQKHNLNAIKAILHNAAYVHLRKKIKTLPSLTVVDQFAPKDLYYRYLKDEKTIVEGLTFQTKAESSFFAVACASVIARYHFLLAFDAMNEKYGRVFPKGASATVDQAAREFIAAFGRDQLGEVAKLHFKNTKNLD